MPTIDVTERHIKTTKTTFTFDEVKAILAERAVGMADFQMKSVVSQLEIVQSASTGEFTFRVITEIDVPAYNKERASAAVGGLAEAIQRIKTPMSVTSFNPSLVPNAPALSRAGNV